MANQALVNIRLAPITVCHADGQQFRRELLGRVFAHAQSAVTLVQCTHCREVAGVLRARAVDVVLLAYCEHSTHLKTTITDWRRLRPALGVILLSAVTHPRYRQCAQWAGADGYVQSTDGLEALWQAIREVTQGSRPPAALLTVPDVTAAGAMDGPLARLSAREFEVLLRICRGLTLKEIAAELGIETRTVGEYRRRLAQKLDLANPADLVRFAIEAGLIPCACQAMRPQLQAARD